MSTFNTLYLTEPICDIFIGANTFRSVTQNISTYNTNVLACYVSNVGIVWFYTLIITIVLTVLLFIRIVLIFRYQCCYWIFGPVGTE